MNKQKTQHVTLLEADHNRLKKISKANRRTMRAQLCVMIDEAEAKESSNGKSHK